MCGFSLLFSPFGANKPIGLDVSFSDAFCTILTILSDEASKPSCFAPVLTVQITTIAEDTAAAQLLCDVSLG